MNPQPTATPSSGHGLDLGDIYYVLFRHKWKILLCSLAGILIAFAIYRQESPPFQSEAKLLVRYVLAAEKQSGPAGNTQNKVSPDERGATIMNTEVEILNSLDLAREVAAAIGPEKLLTKVSGGKDASEATALVKGNLSVNVAPGSSVIHISFRHPDADLVQPVLREIIERYFKLHVEAHRANSGVLGDSLVAEADTLRSRLNQTEEDLRRAINRAGGIEPHLAKEAISNQMMAIRRDASGLQADLAARLAIFEEVKKRQPSAVQEPAAKVETPAEVAPSVLDDYRSLINQVAKLQSNEQSLLLEYTAENNRVKDAKAMRLATEAKLAAMRDQYPALVRVTAANDDKAKQDRDALEASTAWIQITALQAKIKEMDGQLEKLRAEMARIEKEEGTVNELKRTRELQEQHYRYYAAALEASRINSTLGEGKVSNITPIQNPSAPFRAAMNLKKVGLSIVIGICSGLAWAFLIELYFDRSVRRPKDLQKLMRVPLFLSIPKLKSKQLLAQPQTARLSLPSGEGGKPSSGELAMLEHPKLGRIDALQPFHETLRDRLIGYFESRNLTHKPKLVAVTGLRRSSGVTTTAAGLARSLSETGEGNVLLVDMTAEQGAAQEFAKGKEVCGLDQVLEARNQAHVHENLYVVAETSNSERLSRNLPQRFTRLVPKLKASDFDYIIFDMPPVSQLSITPRLAGFMDMVLMVVESEKTDREVVEGACALLAESKAHVGIVLNKTKDYVPTGLHQQLSAG